jgi:hypothetical protein
MGERTIGKILNKLSKLFGPKIQSFRKSSKKEKLAMKSWKKSSPHTQIPNQRKYQILFGGILMDFPVNSNK